MNTTKENNYNNRIYWIIISVVIILGTVIRFWGLGKWNLALDEYYIIKSSENILKFGLPELEHGGYYDRGIILQYLTALLLGIGIKAELAGRVITVIANLLTIPPLFYIAKKIGGKFLSLFTIIIFSFSIWEIEFARFARMYAPFQMLFMWYIYFAFDDFQTQKLSNYKWMLILSSLSIFLYEGSIFLAVFNFVPLILTKNYKLKYVLSSVLVFLTSFALNRVNFRRINSGEIFPPAYYDFIESTKSLLPLRIPEILFPFAFNSIISTLFVILIVVLTIYLIWKIYTNIENKKYTAIIVIICLGITAITNQFGLFVFSFLILFLYDFVDRALLTKNNILLIISIFLSNIVFWYIFGLFNQDWYVLFDNFSSYSTWGVSKRLFVAFFNYPNTYYSFANYFITLPLLTIFSTFMLLILFLLLLYNKIQDRRVNFLFGSMIFLILLSSVPKLLYEETRYTFFLVPIIITLVILTFHHLSQMFFAKSKFSTLFTFLAIIIIFNFSNDFNLKHILNIDAENYNYRLNYGSRMKNHLYRRWDSRSTTEYVKNNMTQNDLIIINENSLEYYLPKVDYFNFYYKHSAFPAITSNSGLNEKWSGAKLIYKNEDLLDIIENRNETIWYLAFPEFWLRDINFYQKYKNNLVFKGIDNLIEVYKFPQKN